MRAAGLKTDIVITLVLVLGTTTLLANLVMTMFWQQSLVRMEIHRVTSILRIEGKLLDTKLTAPAAMTGTDPALLESIGAECFGLQHPASEKAAIYGSCRHINELQTALETDRQNRSPTVAKLGSTWGVFAARPEYLLVAVPWETAGSGTGTIGAVTSLKPIYAAMRQKQKAILAYLLINILLLGTVGFFRLVKSTIKPVEHLVRLSENFDDQHDFHLFPDRPGSEYGQLALALNRMLKRIDQDRLRLRQTVASLEAANTRLKQTQQDMIRAEKLAAVGRLSAGLAHEIGNPIGIIQGYLELLQRETMSLEERRQFSQRAIGELNRINQLIRQLLDFARTSPSGTQKILVNRLLEDIVDLFMKRSKMENIRFLLNLDAKNDQILANEEGVRQVLLNCLLNGVDAITDKGPSADGTIEIITRDASRDNQSPSLAIIIRDNGVGIDPAHLNNIFDPFFTTKEPGRGTGLGLSVSNSIIEAAGGKIEVHSKRDAGTEIIIHLPRAE